MRPKQMSKININFKSPDQISQSSVSPKQRQQPQDQPKLLGKQTLTSSAANVLSLKKNLQITSSGSNLQDLKNQPMSASKQG